MRVVDADRQAIQSLSKARTQQLDLLASELKKLSSMSLTTAPVPPTSQNPYALTAPKPVAKLVVDQKQVKKLLRLVVEGEQDQAEKMLKKDPNLLLIAGTVTDLSGREFKQITAFQYALWALDWHMWKMIQKYLPTEAQTEQFAALETKSTAHGKHFSLQPLIGALQTYVDNAGKVWNYDQRATDHWCKKVGRSAKITADACD